MNNISTRYDNQKPLVSVILPVYNRENLVAEAIESILGQTYPNIELILINDGSTDGTVSILSNYVDQFPMKVKLINRLVPSGPGGYGASNDAMKIATGAYITRMDSDDIAHPDRIRQEVEFMESHPDHVMVGTFANYIDADGEILGVKKFPIENDQIYRDFAVANPLMHPAVLIRRSLLKDPYKLYTSRFGINDDYFMLFGLLNRGKAHNIPEALHSYRVHSGNGSLQNFKKLFLDTAKIRLAAIREFGYKPSPKAVVIFGAQLAMSIVLPEIVLRKIYFALRGTSFPGVRLQKFIAFAYHLFGVKIKVNAKYPHQFSKV